MIVVFYDSAIVSPSMHIFKIFWLTKKVRSFLNGEKNALCGTSLLKEVQGALMGQISSKKAAILYELEARLWVSLDQGDQAVMPLSKSLVLQYTQSKIQLLSHLLGICHDSGMGRRDTEISFLEAQLFKTSAPLKKVIHRRLQLIHEYGQASSLDKQPYPNFQKAFFYKATQPALKKNQSVQPIDIVIITDDGYAPHASVVMLSALYHQGSDTHYIFHILSAKGKLSPTTQRKLKAVAQYGTCTIHFHFFDESLIPEAAHRVIQRTSYPILIAYRLFYGTVFSKLDRIISLDADLIVQHDLGPLASIPLGEKAFCGATDPIPHLRKSDLGLLKSDPYLNCGVMIFHLKKMREMGFEQTSIKCIEQKADQLILLEQDVMNMCFQKEMGILDASWNVPIRALFHKKYLGQSVHTFWPKILHFILYAKKSREKGIKPWMHPKDGRHVWRTDPQKIPFYMRTYWAYRDVGGFD